MEMYVLLRIAATGGVICKALIESNPKVMMGKPVIAGTRVTVELILEKLAAGESPPRGSAILPLTPAFGLMGSMPAN